MCFYIENENSEILKAKKNIECFKVMHFSIQKEKISIYSPYQQFVYKKNKLYNLKEQLEIWRDQIDEGYHSYTSLNKAKRKRLNDQRTWGVIIKCIIPKGSKYYINESRQEYVSNKIKAVEIVCLDQNRKLRNKQLINQNWK